MKKLIVFLILVMAVSVNAANLRWNASDDADGYTVYFNEFNYDAGNALEVLEIVDTLNLQPGTTYSFTVRAYNQIGESKDSNIAMYTTADVYTPLENNLPIRITRPSTITIIVE